MALEFGWTFEYIDGLGLIDYADVLAYWSGSANAEEFNNKTGDA